ncbi:hypothetical protein CR51_03200 [Caballeronia megalochromosomata]|jgi:hypothetical protein|nr:hypothetical protein CR51_03200 [Caballeronia megalochromosomata]
MLNDSWEVIATRRRKSMQPHCFVMFVHYTDAAIRQRFFDSACTCAAWQRAMTDLKSMAAISDFQTFSMAYVSKGAVVTV